MEGWAEEKWPLVSSQDYGEDEAGTTRLIKKHQVPYPEHPPHSLDLGNDGPSEKLLSHAQRALPISQRHRALLFLPEDTAGPFPTTHPNPAGSLLLPSAPLLQRQPL